MDFLLRWTTASRNVSKSLKGGGVTFLTQPEYLTAIRS